MRQPKFARTIVWLMRSPRSSMKCVLQPGADGVDLLVLHDNDIAIRDTFPAILDARLQADALRDRLLARGWQQVIS